MAVLVRVVDEYRYGLREIVIEDLRTIADTWSLLNDGWTPSEAALRLMHCHADE